MHAWSLTWPFYATLAAWEGITCGPDATGASRVIGISLPSRGLAGTLPPELGERGGGLMMRCRGADAQLQILPYQYVAHPPIGGGGSSSFTPKQAARTKSNTRPMPPRYADDLTELQSLVLDGNPLTGSIPALPLLARLQTLNLAGTSLEVRCAWLPCCDRKLYASRLLTIRLLHPFPATGPLAQLGDAAQPAGGIPAWLPLLWAAASCLEQAQRPVSA